MCAQNSYLIAMKAQFCGEKNMNGCKKGKNSISLLREDATMIIKVHDKIWICMLFSNSKLLVLRKPKIFLFFTFFPSFDLNHFEKWPCQNHIPISILQRFA